MTKGWKTGWLWGLLSCGSLIPEANVPVLQEHHLEQPAAERWLPRNKSSCTAGLACSDPGNCVAAIASCSSFCYTTKICFRYKQLPRNMGAGASSHRCAGWYILEMLLPDKCLQLTFSHWLQACTWSQHTRKWCEATYVSGITLSGQQKASKCKHRASECAAQEIPVLSVM